MHAKIYAEAAAEMQAFRLQTCPFFELRNVSVFFLLRCISAAIHKVIAIADLFFKCPLCSLSTMCLVFLSHGSVSFSCSD